jgi:hypothetical protein
MIGHSTPVSGNTFKVNQIMEREFEEDSTDVGSSISDADTTCSSVSAPSTKKLCHLGMKVKHSQRQTARCSGGRRRPVPRSLCLGPAGCDTNVIGTPLETIPGTPIAQAIPSLALASPKQRKETPGVTTQHEFKRPPGLSSPAARQKILAASPTVFAYDPPSNAQSGHTCQHLDRVGQELGGKNADRFAMPMKVFMEGRPEACAKALDPNMPAKKRPVYAEFCKDVQIKPSEEFARFLPLKKRVSKFLMAEPPYMMPARMVPR